jgi:NapH/MauN family ferredoxin-type protein
MKNKTRWYRYVLQIFFFVFIGLIAVNHVLAESGGQLFGFIPSVSLHAICPFGAIESIISLVTAGSLVPKLQMSNLVISAIILLITLVFGAVFCSFVCPLGTIQEWIGKIGKKLFKGKYNTFIPQKLHNILRYFRYLSLAAVVLLTFSAARLIFADVDPFYAMYHFFTDEVTIGSLIVLAVTLIGSLFVERPWCKYVCPYGALLGLVGKFSLLKIRRNSQSCNSCTLCDKQCPVNIEISKHKTIGHAACIRCMDCVEDDTSCTRSCLAYSVRKPAKGETQ